MFDWVPNTPLGKGKDKNEDDGDSDNDEHDGEKFVEVTKPSTVTK